MTLLRNASSSDAEIEPFRRLLGNKSISRHRLGDDKQALPRTLIREPFSCLSMLHVALSWVGWDRFCTIRMSKPEPDRSPVLCASDFRD